MSTTQESTEKRIEKAKTENMEVTVHDADMGMVKVTSETGNTYAVIINGAKSRCTCPDHEYRETSCKHIRRAAAELGIING